MLLAVLANNAAQPMALPTKGVENSKNCTEKTDEWRDRCNGCEHAQTLSPTLVIHAGDPVCAEDKPHFYDVIETPPLRRKFPPL